MKTQMGDDFINDIGICPIIDDNEQRIWQYKDATKTVVGYKINEPSNTRTIDVSSLVTTPPGASISLCLDIHGNRLFMVFVDNTNDTVDIYVVK